MRSMKGMLSVVYTPSLVPTNIYQGLPPVTNGFQIRLKQTNHLVVSKIVVIKLFEIWKRNL